MSLILTAKYQIKTFKRTSIKVTTALIERVEQLEKEKYESIEAWNSQLEKASARVKELKQENADLKEFRKEWSDTHIHLEGRALAERDKQVKVETIDKFVNLLLNFKGRELSEGDEYTVELVANQLKRK